MADSQDSPSSGQLTAFGHEMRKHFLFDKDYVNLNHGSPHIPSPPCPVTDPLLPGSFGTYPSPIRTRMHAFQDRAEAYPDCFIRYEYPRLLDASRQAMATLLKVPVETVVFLPNATTGINTVLRSLRFEKGDRIVYFSTIYGSCEKTIDYISETTPAEGVKVEYTYPVSDGELVRRFEEVLATERKAGNTVRVALFDTVSSLPGVRMPFERLTEVCGREGVLSLIDGAHGVGHLPLDLGKLQPDFFVSNCHKYVSLSLTPAYLATSGVVMASLHPTQMAFRPPRLRRLPRPAQEPGPDPLLPAHKPRLRALPRPRQGQGQQPPPAKHQQQVRRAVRVRRHHRQHALPMHPRGPPIPPGRLRRRGDNHALLYRPREGGRHHGRQDPADGGAG